MSYKKYVELLDLNNITLEPTEAPIYFNTFTPTIYIIQNKKQNNNTDLILVVFFSSLSGMLFIILVLWCKYKCIKKNNSESKEPDISSVSDDNSLSYDSSFGIEYILDDI